MNLIVNEYYLYSVIPGLIPSKILIKMTFCVCETEGVKMYIGTAEISLLKDMHEQPVSVLGLQHYLSSVAVMVSLCTMME